MLIGLPVGGAPESLALLPGPFEPERLIKLPRPWVMPVTTRVKLLLRAGDFSAYELSFCSFSWSKRVLLPKLLLEFYLFAGVVIWTLPGRYFLIQLTWTRACLVL